MLLPKEVVLALDGVGCGVGFNGWVLELPLTQCSSCPLAPGKHLYMGTKRSGGRQFLV